MGGMEALSSTSEVVPRELPGPGGFLVKEAFSPTKEPIMSLIAVVAGNAILTTAVVAALAYVCRIPYRLDRVARLKEMPAGTEEIRVPAYEQSAA
jgi:hypothetical protein